MCVKQALCSLIFAKTVFKTQHKDSVASSLVKGAQESMFWSHTSHFLKYLPQSSKRGDSDYKTGILASDSISIAQKKSLKFTKRDRLLSSKEDHSNP